VTGGELAGRLAALDTCAVSDALDRLGIAGAALGLSATTVPRRIAGAVITVQLGPAEGTRGDRHLGTAAIEAAEPGDVIVVAAGGRTDAGGWGGVLSQAAVLRRVEGVIVDGACRDVDEARSVDLPVYARGGVPRTARGRLAEIAMDVPVTVAGIEVWPGDLVLADGSGVVFLPSARACEVVETAEKIAAKERAMVERLKAGVPVSRVMSRDYETMLDGERQGRHEHGDR
jgi:regulator of RNase E activity RraA